MEKVEDESHVACASIKHGGMDQIRQMPSIMGIDIM